MQRRLLHRWLTSPGALARAAFIAGAAQASVVCTGPGYTPGCEEVDAAPFRIYGRPVNRPGYR